MTSKELHEKAYAVAGNIKANYLELFEVLLEIERRQIFLGFDVTDLKVYCIELLQLSPSIAKDFVIVVKKPIEVPALVEAIRSKKTTIYKLRKVCSVITEKTADEWIALTCECSTRIVERAVAMAKPREAVQESLTYVSGDVLEFKLAVSQEWVALLRQTKDLMSQKQKRAVSSEQAIQELMTKYCEKEDPVKKAERWAKRESAMTERRPVNSRAVKGVSRTRYRPSRIEHEVNLRDNGQCTHVNGQGKRCEQKRWLEKHHRVEFAQGDEHTVDNLVTLCSAHHRMQHFAETQH